jgi:uncharacterized protein (TIGR03067 family)
VDPGVDGTVRIDESTFVRRQKLPAGAVPGSFYLAGTNARMGDEKDSSGQQWVIVTFSYVLHTETTPTGIDLSVVDDKGTRYLFKGIADLQSDRLAICYSEPGGARPKGCARMPDGGGLSTLRREKQ